MIDANIKNDCHTRRMTVQVYEALTTPERNKLKKKISGRGNLKATCIALGVAEYTVKRAAAGLNLLPETAAKFRLLLNTESTRQAI